jgi:hypothetical protein
VYLFHPRQCLGDLLHLLGNKAATLLQGIQRLLERLQRRVEYAWWRSNHYVTRLLKIRTHGIPLLSNVVVYVLNCLPPFSVTRSPCNNGRIMRKCIDELGREGTVTETEGLGELRLDGFIFLDPTGYAL